MVKSEGIKKRHRGRNTVLILFLLIILGGAGYLSTLLPIITGYAAKNMGSAVFVSGRTPADVDSTDLNFSFIKFTKNKVDFTDNSVTSRFLWGISKAVYNNGFGVTLVRKADKDDIMGKIYPEIPPLSYSKDTTAWPMGDLLPGLPVSADSVKLARITAKIIDENGYGGNAFAFMVLHRGVPVAEGYKPQFSKDTRFLSWSMAKSVINAMIGVMVREYGLDINKPAAIEEWQSDGRREITLNHLMQMTSGIKWNEDYGSRSDVNVMLFCRGDMAAYVSRQKLEYPAGSYWEYSSGSSNVLSYIIRKHFDNDQAYYAFPQTHLFQKIGIANAVFEIDPSGTYIGSSYLYATARDYARFALLYIQDGVFNGERLLPEGWVKYTREPAQASNSEYGSLFWLYGNDEVRSAPGDVFMCVGHDGQRIFIIPSKELIVVVLGYSPRGTMDFDALLKDVVGAIHYP